MFNETSFAVVSPDVFFDESGNPILAQVLGAAPGIILAARGQQVYQVGRNQPNLQAPNQAAGVNVNGGLNNKGLGGSLNISTNTLLLVGIVAAFFILGQNRGRR